MSEPKKPGEIGAIEYIDGIAFESVDGADLGRCTRCRMIVDAGYEARAHAAEHRFEDLEMIEDAMSRR